MRESVPSFRDVRETVLPSREEDFDDEVPVKKAKGDTLYNKKAEELERKLETIQKSREKTSEKPPINGKSILGNTLSTLTKKIPLETNDGKIIEQKPKHHVDFGSWDFPSIKLLNEIEHRVVVSPEEIEEKSLLIEKTLLQFGIDVEMEGESVGPTVIQYRLRPSE